EKTYEEEEANKMYNDVNINLEGRDTEMTDALLANVQATQVTEDTHSSFVSSGFISKMLNPNPEVSSILSIADKYLANQMNEAVTVVVQLQPDRLRDEAKAKNEDFINKINENIKKSSRSKSKYMLRSKFPRFYQELRSQ
nr:hypothetical protein [Tanacetum cinerariifolium]